MEKRHIAIIGAGGHAEVVASVILASGDSVAGFYADVPSLWGTAILGAPVLGPVSEITSARCSHTVIGIGANDVRKKFAETMDMDWATVIHPFSWVHPEVLIGCGSVVCAGAIVQPGAHVGAHVILNTKASVDHHCRVGDYAHIAVAASCRRGIDRRRGFHGAEQYRTSQGACRRMVDGRRGSGREKERCSP